MLRAGGVVLEIMASSSGGPPVRNQLEAWITNNGLKVTCVMDISTTMTVTLNTYGIRESAFIVDLPTARIIRKYNGRVDGVGPSAISQANAEMLRLLGVTD